jgi:hypothetical protein
MLSEAAVALLKRRITGERVAVTEENLPAYRELARAGVMATASLPGVDPESHFRFTIEGWDRRMEWIGVPAGSPIRLTESAENLLQRRLVGERVEVTEENLPAYRELAGAGLAVPISTFLRGPDSHFRLTKEACDRREEWLTPSASDPPRSP